MSVFDRAEFIRRIYDPSVPDYRVATPGYSLALVLTANERLKSGEITDGAREKLRDRLAARSGHRSWEES